jgi:uncharacterized protein (TIGR02722 family)
LEWTVTEDFLAMKKTTLSWNVSARRLWLSAGCLGLIAVLSGCQTTTQSVHVAKPVHMDESYDYTDLRNAASVLAESILSKPPIAVREDRPVLIPFGITNRTSEHLDTKALVEKMQIQLLNSQKVRLVSADQRENILREIEYQDGGLVDPATMITLGKQVGADYAVSGSIMEITKQEGRGIRLTKTSLKYYKIHLELTNLNTALIEWTDEYEFARETSRPIIGW